MKETGFKGFKIGDKVEINYRGNTDGLYLYVKKGHRGVITSLNTDSITEKKVAFVKFDKPVTIDGKSISDWEEPFFLYTLKKYKNKQKVKVISNTTYYLCSDCGNYHKNITVNKNKKICDDCLQYYKVCNCCSKFLNEDKTLKDKDGKIICSSCFKKLYKICTCCGKIVLKTNTVKIKGKIVCILCKKSNYRICGDCGKLTQVNELKRVSNSDLILCDMCFYIKCPIKNYTYSPKKLPLFKNKWEKKEKLFLGMELEVLSKNRDSKNFLGEQFQKFLIKNKIVKYFYCKNDSSLSTSSGRKGFEIVTNPFTLQMKKKLKLKTILNWLRENDFRSYEFGKCGIHIHMSRDFFSDSQIKKLRLFFYTNWERIYKFSKRRGSGGSFVSKEIFNIHDFKKGKGQSGRHFAVNINSSKATVEIRIFRGTLNYERLLSTLLFCDSVAYFTKYCSFKSIGDSKLSWKSYKTFLEKENRYGYLIKYLKKENLY